MALDYEEFWRYRTGHSREVFSGGRPGLRWHYIVLTSPVNAGNQLLFLLFIYVYSGSALQSPICSAREEEEEEFIRI